MTAQRYVYQVAEVVRVVDGDTFWLRVDVGFRFLALVNVRLHGWDCPEARRGSEFEKARAVDARALTAGFFDRHTPAGLWLASQPDPDVFGRWLGRVWHETPAGALDLGEALHAAQLATPWPTRWRTVFDSPL